MLALVAEGLSDREIGTRLFISHRTVERHVSSLLAKLDAARRAELAALAHRLDLVPTPRSLASKPCEAGRRLVGEPVETPPPLVE